MTTTVHPDVMDSALALLSANTQTIAALSALPNVYTDAAPGARLAGSSMSSGDFTVEDSPGGRRLSIATKATTVDTTGTAAAIALLDDTNQRILFSAPIPSVQVTGGDVVHFLSWSISLAATA